LETRRSDRCSRPFRSSAIQEFWDFHGGRPISGGASKKNNPRSEAPPPLRSSDTDEAAYQFPVSAANLDKKRLRKDIRRDKNASRNIRARDSNQENSQNRSKNPRNVQIESDSDDEDYDVTLPIKKKELQPISNTVTQAQLSDSDEDEDLAQEIPKDTSRLRKLSIPTDSSLGPSPSSHLKAPPRQITSGLLFESPSPTSASFNQSQLQAQTKEIPKPWRGAHKATPKIKLLPPTKSIGKSASLSPTDPRVPSPQPTSSRLRPSLEPLYHNSSIIRGRPSKSPPPSRSTLSEKIRSNENAMKILLDNKCGYFVIGPMGEDDSIDVLLKSFQAKPLATLDLSNITPCRAVIWIDYKSRNLSGSGAVPGVDIAVPTRQMIDKFLHISKLSSTSAFILYGTFLSGKQIEPTHAFPRQKGGGGIVRLTL